MESFEFNQHISRKFNEELEQLRDSVLRMGGLVQEQLDRAIEAVVSGDSELGLRVAHDDYKVNRLEVEIDEECSRLLALRAPAATDLRLIVAVIKTITDLERVGDEAEKIGFLASRLAEVERPKDRYRELRNLGRHVSQMLTDTLDAFSRFDVDQARRVVAEDRHVDTEYDAIARQCITFMMEDNREIRRFMDVTWAARALERIGDHAKNICEYVLFLVLGKDVRHLDLNVDPEGAPKNN